MANGWGGARPRSGPKRNGSGPKKQRKQQAEDNVVRLSPRREMAMASLVAQARAMRATKVERVPLKLPEPPPGVVPDKKFALAMDSDISTALTWANNQFDLTTFNTIAREGLLFLGYAYLSELAQRAEYRIPTETIATEMTRKWIKFKAAVDKRKKREEHRAEEEEAETEQQEQFEQQEEESDGESDDDDGGENDTAEDRAPVDERDDDADERSEDDEDETAAERPDEDDSESEKLKEEREAEEDDKTDRIKELEDEFDRLQVQDAFKHIAMNDGFFGRAHLFLDLTEEDEQLDAEFEELKFDIGDGRDEISAQKVGKDRPLRRIKVIEPVWTYPTTYNAINPLRDDWYAPTVWYVMGRQVHISRLLTFVGRPVPDLLKPSYMFGGLSLSQLVKPYVDLWLDTRQNIGHLIQAFSVMVLQTNLTGVLQTGGTEMMTRANLFNETRDNAGLMMIDKNTEDFKNVSAPLGGLDHLQAQSQEHMMSVVRIPAVKFTGIQPTGLNASSEGEIRTFYDTIAAYQESFFRPNLTKLMHFVMLSLWGEVDEEITFEFEPLWALTKKEEAEVRKMEAETDDILINGCAALRPEEVRERIASDPDTPYAGLDVSDLPEQPELGEQGLATGGKVNIKGTQGFGGGPGGKQGGGAPFGGGNGGGDDANPFGRDDDFKESEHPRGGDPEHPGRFSKGSGGGGSKKSEKEEEGTAIPRGLQNVLNRPAVSGKLYRKELVKVISEAKSGGHDEWVIKRLEGKLIDSMKLSHERFVAKGLTDKAAKMAEALAKKGVKVEVEGEPKPEPPKEGAAKKAPRVLIPQEELRRLLPGEVVSINEFAGRVQTVVDQLAPAFQDMLVDVAILVEKKAQKLGSMRGRYAGVYNSFKREIRLPYQFGGKFKVAAHNEANTLTHEAAHAIDHQYGWRLGDLVAPYVDSDAASHMTNQERSAAKYWFTNNAERFAELFSLAYAPKNPGKSYVIQSTGERRSSEPSFYGGMTRERANVVFAKSLEYVRGLGIGDPKVMAAVLG